MVVTTIVGKSQAIQRNLNTILQLQARHYERLAAGSFALFNNIIMSLSKSRCSPVRIRPSAPRCSRAYYKRASPRRTHIKESCEALFQSPLHANSFVPIPPTTAGGWFPLAQVLQPGTSHHQSNKQSVGTQLTLPHLTQVHLLQLHETTPKNRWIDSGFSYP